MTAEGVRVARQLAMSDETGMAELQDVVLATIGPLPDREEAGSLELGGDGVDLGAVVGHGGRVAGGAYHRLTTGVDVDTGRTMDGSGRR